MLLFLLIMIIYLAFIFLLGFGIYKLTNEKPKAGFSLLFSGILGILGMTILLIANAAFVDGEWFSNLGYEGVFWKIFWVKWKLFLYGSFISFAIICSLRIGIIFKFSSREGKLFDDYLSHSPKVINLMLFMLTGALSLIMGFWAAFSWEKIFMFQNSIEYGQTDVIFSKDIGYYLFTFPFLRMLLWWIGVNILFGIIINLWCRYIYREEGIGMRRFFATTIWIVIFLIFQRMIATKGLMFSERGAVFGPGYADIHAQITMNNLFIWVAAVAAALMIVFLLLKKSKAFGLTWAGLGAFLIFGVWTIPALNQAIIVSPTELDKEREYISYNIDATRQAFGLDMIEEKAMPLDTVPVKMQDLMKYSSSFPNIRLCDPNALLMLLKQEQEIRTYYAFDDVDVDRYYLDGKYASIMLSGRELNINELPESSKNWVNQRLKYTHGYGLVTSKVNDFSSDGFPSLLVKDIPPKGNLSRFRITRPEIYYGSLTDNYVITNTTTDEFDYGEREENIYCRYEGNGGVKIGSGIRKWGFAVYFSHKILFSEYLQEESKILFKRDIHARVQKLAPFLTFDKDQYMVVDETGRLFFIIDGYTSSSFYPYSERYDEVNYIRNSVKAVVDAYNGEVYFYVVDVEDILLRVWRKIFPNLFLSFKQMPEDLKSHLRYPEDMLVIQQTVYGKYHMVDPEIFYNSEDFWEPAEELYIDSCIRMCPYYVILQLPGEEKAEFIQIAPYNPRAKKNMIAWIAGRCDAENYGKAIVLTLPKGQLFKGPRQIEALIDQSPEISSQLTLWKNKGSDVIRGNLLVIPIANTLLYVEPIYLFSEDLRMPQLVKVIVYINGELEWGDTFLDALTKAIGSGEVYFPSQSSQDEGLTDKNVLIQLSLLLDQYYDLMAKRKAEEAGKTLETINRVLNQHTNK